ncbi:MAG: hypothetical protein ACREK2_07915 [Gemmatimonadota bacterium]
MLGMNPLTLLDLLGQPEFQMGFAVGIIGLIAALIVRKAGWLLVWGMAAIGALGWAGLLWWTEETPDWGLAAAVVTAVAAAAAFRVLMRQVPAWPVGIVFALWVLGVWGTVPDTERAAVVMGVTAAMLPALWPGLRVRVGWEGAAVAVAALGFVTITDGAARSATMVGALGMVGMPVVAAAVCHWLRSGRRPSPWWLVAAQVVHVIVSGRVAGQTFQPEGALIVVILSALATGGWLAWGVRPGP